mmetsp:Transcript_24971/g.27788  ORF Transcript_24971/g.27788 Transcript_24971/m.27788 type:complete len:320 (+) Transcript_24971:59-1018(+)
MDPLVVYGAIGVVVLVVAWYMMKIVSAAERRKRLLDKSREIKVTELNIYPIKSCCQVRCQKVQIDKYGFEYDREWMVVDDSKYRMVTARQIPKLMLVKPTIGATSLTINAPDMPTIEVPLAGLENNTAFTVGVWKQTSAGIDQGDEVAAWFTKYLGKSVRLVRVPRSNPDLPNLSVGNPKYHVPNASIITAFSDGFPYLVLSEESLEWVNREVKDKPDGQLSTKRFRPNIVVKGASALEENQWREITVKDVPFYLTKACPRCKMTTIIPEKGAYGNKEPLVTITAKNNGNFGQNAMHATGAEGTWIKVGDTVRVINVAA